MRSGISLFILLCCFSGQLRAQRDSSAVIDGWTFGGVPVIAYDADFGLQYGALGNFYYYGDGGERYPYYDHSIFLEATNTTRGERKVRLRYDARQMIPEGRFKMELMQLLTLNRPFYGFNGYESYYANDLINRMSSQFISPLYYAYQQKVWKAAAIAEKNLRGKQLRITSEVQFFKMDVSAADRDKYNEGKPSSDWASDSLTLYEQLVDWNVIDAQHQNGGTYGMIAVGGVVDTRDIEPWPRKGLWEEVSLSYGIPLDGVSPQTVSLRLIHRHYQTLITDRLVLAHRIQYRTFLSKEAPFYQLQILGGEDDLRGIRYARLAAMGVAGANVELRWKVFKWVIFNQNIYGGINLFFDTGMVTRRYDFDDSGVPNEYNYLINTDAEKLHHASGMGVKGALNENFIIAIDYGKALDARDGESGLYITLGWLF